MDRTIRVIFRNTVEFLRSEVKLMPLSRWDESVLRYHFGRLLATDYPEVEQLVECDTIDLVLRRPPSVAFIEFKLYRKARRLDPYDGRPRGYKGGPSLQNVREFQACVDQLHERRSKAHLDLSKYIILVYADSTDVSRSNRRFSRYYDDYHHPRECVSLRRMECAGPIETTEAMVQAQLYQVA